MRTDRVFCRTTRRHGDGMRKPLPRVTRWRSITLGGCISTGRAFRRITQRRGSGGSKRQPRVTPGHRSTLAGCISTDRVCRRVLCETRCDLADDATTCLSHCRYAHAGIGEAVSGQVLITGERRRAAWNEPTDCDIQHSRSEWTG